MKIKVRAHTCYLGKSGYAAHARSFFRELSKRVDLRVRNFTWDDDSISYLEQRDYDVLETITLSEKGSLKDFPFSSSFPEARKNFPDFVPDVDIVLMETDHHYFYQDYQARIKVAYTVWESTLLPQPFFERLLDHFDYLWVATEWHKATVIKQGFPPHRVFVVNEGIDDIFFTNVCPARLYDYENDRFKFLLFGRWDYRKAVPEIVRAFLDAFPDDEPVDLILSADNPFAIDGLSSTEDRLRHHGLVDHRIIVKHFVSRDDYVSFVKNGHVFLSCARSEGWNIPLAEAMAAGTPSIYSEWGAQLEFARGKGNPVRILEERPASLGSSISFARTIPGEYAEPDFKNLSSVIRECYDHYSLKLEKARNDRELMRRFTWEAAADSAMKMLQSLEISYAPVKTGEGCIVLAHADTADKEALLRDCVLEMRRQGMTTIVSSHIPVSEEIHQLADFVVYDKDNALIQEAEYRALKGTHHQIPIFFMTWPGWSLTYAYDSDHGYAILRLLKNALGLCVANSIDIVHVVNYDFIISDPEVFQTHSRELREEEYDIVSYKHSEMGDDSSINTGVFSARVPELCRATESFKSKQDYYRYPAASVFEEQFTMIVRDAGMRNKMRVPTILHEKNTINAFVIPSNPGVGKRDCFCFLVKDPTGDHIFLQGFKTPFVATVVSGDISCKIEVPLYPPVFLKVSPANLSDGVKVTIDAYNFEMFFDHNSKRAESHIQDTALVKTMVTDEIENEIRVTFQEGPRAEILGSRSDTYRVKFIDTRFETVIFETIIANNHWAACSKRYFVPWRVEIISMSTGKISVHHHDLSGKRVFFAIDSSSLGDTIAWFAPIEKFCKQHECNGIVSTFKNDLFKGSYPELEFVPPGHPVQNIYSTYLLGWFYNGDSPDSPDFSKHPADFRAKPMQATVTDILGMPFSTIKPRISHVPVPLDRPLGKYVCIGMHSTAQAKYWNNYDDTGFHPAGWQTVVHHFRSKGYSVVHLSLEKDGYMGNRHPTGIIELTGDRSMANTMDYLLGAEMFIGVGSGLSWLSWALGVPTVIISGFSKPYTEPEDENVLRISNPLSCNGCFNRARLDAGDWNWCPDHKGTSRQFECTRSILGKDVVAKIESFLEGNTSVSAVLRESYELGMKQNYTEIYEAADFFKNLKVSTFVEIGTDQGGTFAIWSKLSGDGTRISVDLPHGQFGVNTYDVTKRDEYLRSLGSDVHMIHGSSHEPVIRDVVRKLLNGKLADFLFIDGDHTYEGVKQDYEMYKNLVKPGGWIGFHDIKDTPFHRSSNCRVDILWNEISGRKVEFLDNSSEFGGIGFVQN